jgi:hypothetical protein
MSLPEKSRPHGRKDVTTACERVYRSLLRAYPREFRDEYGDEMARDFRDLCRDARDDESGQGLAMLWVRTLPELVWTALGERRATWARKAYRTALGLAIATALFLGWVNLAVGVIGSEDNPANLMYWGVLAIGTVGALIARFRPRGMARALFATALAQALVPMIALIVGRPRITSLDAVVGVVGVLCVNAMFILLFAGSALLFLYAGQEQTPTGANPAE